MHIVIIALAIAAVLIVGLVMVGSAVAKTRSMPDQIVIDAHEAIEFCAEALPSEVTAVLSYDQLRRALRLHLEWIQAYHWAPQEVSTGSASGGTGTETDGPIIFEVFDAVDYVMERADAVGLDLSRAQAVSVIEAHTAFLRVVGALHLDDPADMEADLADVPMLGAGPTSHELNNGPDQQGS